MHKIECVPCGNRVFANREALQQHLKTSSSYHPICEICDKRFSSESGLEAHKVAKHPPTFDCTICNRPFKQIFALEDHYRGSERHPNCARCGKGFRDMAELEQHRNTAHVQVVCTTCGETTYEDQDSLERHYMASEHHPKCIQCKKGFLNQEALREHEASAHGEAQPSGDANPASPSPSQTAKAPVTGSSTTPSGPAGPLPMGVPHAASLPGPPAPYPRMYEAHPSGYHADLPPVAASPHPLRDLRRPVRVDSPDISRLSVAFSSPLMGVQAPPFSPMTPVGLAPPGKEMNELWNAKENIQVPPVSPTTSTVGPAPLASNNSQISPEQRFAALAGAKITYDAPVSRQGSYAAIPSRSPVAVRERSSSANSPPSSSIQAAFPTGLEPLSSAPYRPTILRSNTATRFGYAGNRFSSPPTSPPDITGGSQLTNGSHTRPALLTGFPVGFRASRPRFISPPTSSSGSSAVTPDSNIQPIHLRASSSLREFDPRAAQESSRQITRSSTITPNSIVVPVSTAAASSFSQRASSTPSAHSALPQPRGHIPNGVGNANADAIARTVRCLMDDDAASIEEYNSETPKVASSPKKEDDGVLVSTEEFTSASESEVWVSSPSSSHSVASSKNPGLDDSHLLTSDSSAEDEGLPADLDSFSLTTSRDSFVYRSPEGSSPIGLATGLPAISPLLETTIDLSTFDWPETKYPLPESTPSSPTLLADPSIIDDTLEISPPGLQTSSFSSPGNESFVTSPQELQPENHNIDFETPETKREDPLPDTDDTLVQGLLEKSSDLHTKDPGVEVAVQVEAKQPLSPLHCRECKSDPCDDTTATMCGHIFCNRCIVNAVIKTSRCPLCSTPTLLYCLFRLDLETGS
ncbi:hypothetical protein CC2G_004062 [Coprinopsis cinerea AmutBmut pab1-1]|nr:hypothetical protein CC2G_004062 [Coprinopsis cinerea AmutBmut pab1-1]